MGLGVSVGVAVLAEALFFLFSLTETISTQSPSGGRFGAEDRQSAVAAGSKGRSF